MLALHIRDATAMPLPDTLQRRPATEADIPALLALRRQTMEDHMRAAGVDTSDAHQMDKVRRAFDKAEVLVEDGRIVGLFKSDRTCSPWKVIQIQLAPALQGRGLGRRLLMDFIRDAHAAGEDVTLNVLKHNPARDLYERLGFQPVDRNEEEDAELVMLLSRERMRLSE